MVYSIDELRQRITPVAAKYNLPAVYIFGSYAKNQATENSDVDVLIDKTGSTIKGLFDMGDLYNDLCECLDKGVDLLTTDALEQDDVKRRTPWFTENLMKERVMLYEGK